MATGISLSQFEAITKLGTKMDGRRVLVQCGGPSGDYCCGGSHRAYYLIELPTSDGSDAPWHHAGLWLVPVGDRGNTADSNLDSDDYRYTHGGCLFQAAVDVAKELASALGSRSTP